MALDGALYLAVCDRVEQVSYLDVQLVRRSLLGGYADTAVVLEGNGALFEPGVPYRVGDELAGLRVVERTSEFPSDFEIISVAVTSDLEEGDAVSREIEVPSSGMPEGKWVHADGRISGVPCT